jgi:hypothetical protein
MIEVKRYRNRTATRPAIGRIYVDGELLAVVLYRKGPAGHGRPDPARTIRKGGGDAA